MGEITLTKHERRTYIPKNLDEVLSTEKIQAYFSDYGNVALLWEKGTPTEKVIEQAKILITQLEERKSVEAEKIEELKEKMDRLMEEKSVSI